MENEKKMYAVHITHKTPMRVAMSKQVTELVKVCHGALLAPDGNPDGMGLYLATFLFPTIEERNHFAIMAGSINGMDLLVEERTAYV